MGVVCLQELQEGGNALSLGLEYSVLRSCKLGRFRAEKIWKNC